MVKHIILWTLKEMDDSEKESVKAGTEDSNGHTPYIMDLNTEYTAYNEKGNNTWCFLARNNLNRFKSMGGNWYAIDGYFGNIY